MAFSYEHVRADGVRFQDYRVYARVGVVYLTVALGTTETVDRDAVNELATTQAACLAGGDCRAPIPVPAGIGGADATGVPPKLGSATRIAPYDRALARLREDVALAA